MEGVKDYLCTDLPENIGGRAKGLLQFGEAWRVFSSLFPANFNPLQPYYSSVSIIFSGGKHFKAYQDPFKRSIKTLWGSPVLCETWQNFQELLLWQTSKSYLGPATVEYPPTCPEI